MKLSLFNVIITNQLCYKKEENLIFSDANNRYKRQASSTMCKVFATLRLALFTKCNFD